MRVAIIGAGTCGLYLGWKLAKKGHKIVIFEKNKTVGSKVCSGLFSERILDFIPESKKLTENEINYVLLHFPKKTIRVNFSKKFLVMNHSKLDLILFDLASRAGAQIILDQRITEIPKGFDPSPLAKGEGFERIIGCDGAGSFIRQYLNLPEPKLRMGIQGFVKSECHKDFVEAWPCENGFSWAVPRGEKIEYGTISNPKAAYKIFINFIATYKANPASVKARMIPQGLPKMNNKTITLCGDAAGLTKPWSGGGVIWGLTAANILLENFPNFKKYHKKLKKFFSRKIWVSEKLSKFVYFFGFHLPWFLPNNRKIESDFLF